MDNIRNKIHLRDKTVEDSIVSDIEEFKSIKEKGQQKDMAMRLRRQRQTILRSTRIQLRVRTMGILTKQIKSSLGNM